MIPLAEARQWVLEQVAPLPVTESDVASSVGCVLAEAVVATEPVPPFVGSAMDGYAVRAADTAGAPCRLQVVGTVLAGDDPRFTVGAGQAARIMTGAPLPSGADAVCMVERTRAGDDGTVVVESAVDAGEHVRHPGDDVDRGDVVFPAGTPLTPAHVGVLASLGVRCVAVRPRPRVGVLSTGDELFGGEGPLPPGKIRDSNRPALLATLAADGFDAVDLGVAADDEAAVAAALAGATASCDAVLTSGGVSVGDRDVVRLVLDDMGGPGTRWMQVAIKPAKPLAAGRIGDAGTPFFGLPGNPVSALVSYELFVRPALRTMAGHGQVDRPVLRVLAAEPFRRRPDGKLHLLRACLTVGADGRLLARSAGGQGSHQLRAMADADALVLLPDGDGAGAGEPVAAMVLDAQRIGADGGTHLGLEPGW